MLKTDDCVVGRNEDGGDGEAVVTVFATGVDGQVVPPVFFHVSGVLVCHAPHNAESIRSSEGGVRVELVARFCFRAGYFNPLGRIRTNCDDLVSEFKEVLFDLADFHEVGVAIGAPTTPVEDDDRFFVFYDRQEVDCLAFGVCYCHIGNVRSDE